MQKTILTGDRPTGKLHLGHYVGSLKNRAKLQNTCKQFVMIADVQALTDNADNPMKIKNNILEVAVDYIASGIDPKKTTILVQSMIPEIAELTIYFLNLVTLSRLKRNPTVKTEMKQKKFGSNVPIGFLTYPVSQAADILVFKANLVPVGKDQMPIIEQVNEVAKKFNKIYSPIFPKVKGLLSDTPVLPGIDGKTKMSKSLDNTIYLSDSKKVITEKVMSMYTDPGHIKVGDPGKVEGNVVFKYLDVFDPNKKEVAKLKKEYIKGGLGDVVLKERLINILEDIVKPMREKREELIKDKKKITSILEKGTADARKAAQKTMKEVKKVMKIDYFK